MPRSTLPEVAGDDFRFGQISEVVVAFGEVVGEGIGPAHEIELGGVDEVLPQLLPDAQIVHEQAHRIADEDQDGDEALPVTP